MSVSSMPVKKYEYYILSGVNYADITKLNKDPRGWDNHDIAIQRSDDHGLNINNTVPLSFTGNGKQKVHDLYYATGSFTKAKVLIKERNNSWEFTNFFEYRLDFSTYSESKTDISISGIEDGLLSKIDKFKDTEYEIDLPSSNKQFFNYTGASIYKQNLIQCLYGKLKEKETIGEDNYVLKGNRSVRTYSDKLIFTDSSGLPYETMTLRALTAITAADNVNINVNLALTIVANGTLWNPGKGQLIIYKHDSNFDNKVFVAQSGTSTKSYVSASKRTDIFSWVTTLSNIELNAGQLLSVFYQADNGSYDSVSVEESADAYIKIGAFYENIYQDKLIEVFTFEWIIQQLITKIYPSGVFVSELTYPDFNLVLSASPCIYNMGKQDGTGTLKVSLSDVLKAINILKCIGIDITGNTFTIKPLSSFYKASKLATLEANNIVVEHDLTHQYKNITVGSNVSEKSEDDDYTYPFITEKKFETADSEHDNELDLLNKFMVDPYDIDKYINKLLSESTNKDECKFIVFCTKNITSTSSAIFSDTYTYGLYNETESLVAGELRVSCNIAPELRNYDSKIEINCYCTTPDNFMLNNYIIEIYADGILVESFYGTASSSISHTTTAEIPAGASIDIEYVQSYSIDPHPITTDVIVSLDIYDVYSEPKVFGRELYKNHTMSNFKGDSSTIYNVPLTPKRILQTWNDYLRISTYGNTNGILTFLTSDFKDTDITSKCDFESTDVVEESDYEPIGNPVFLPATIKFNTPSKPSYLINLLNNKYGYIDIFDKKTGKMYSGWIKNFTFAIAKPTEQSIELQARII